MITLRPHQVKAVEDVDALLVNNKNVMCVLPTGAGKSLTLAHYAKRAYINGEVCVIFAHRDVLISQLSEALCKMEIHHSFICSDKARRDITNNNLTKYGNSFYSEVSPIIVSSNPTFAARLKNDRIPSSFLNRVSWWIQDECFPAGTLVDGKPIEQIKVGDLVYSYDFDKQMFVKKPVTHVFVKESPHMMCKVRLTTHHVVDCTMNHPFYTKRGWIPACLLTTDDEVIVNEREIIPYGKLSHLRKTSLTKYELQKDPIQEHEARLLLHRMFDGVSQENQFRNNGEDEPEVCFGKDEEKKPNARCRNTKKNEKHTYRDRSQTSNSGRKRTTTNESGRKALFDVSRFRVSKPGNSENGELGGKRLPSSLQSRLRSQVVKDSNRGRWSKPHESFTSRTRRKERLVPNFTRVESVQVYESRDPRHTGNGFVYNLEVADTHNYVANEILVHNCHHCLAESQLWGSCIKSLPNARGLGFTATPIRGDKKGLGEHTDGFFNALSNTTSMWDLIKAGMLSAYKVFIPPVNIDLSGINVTSSGDYNQKKLAGRVDKREITGDAVQHYLKVSPGQPAITFCVNIEHAKHVAAEFNNAGIPSKAVSSKCPLPDREKTMRDFAEGKILNLVNVDLLSEGYDSPSITTVLMLRPTQSYSLFKQQFGRMLRPAEGKVYGVLLDFVGNVRFMMEQYDLEHIHDDPEWTLDRGTKRAKSGDGKALEKTTICSECAAFYLVSEHGDTCPECGHTETAAEKENNRRQIQQKDGELVELSVDIVEEIIRKRDQEVLLPMEQFSRKVAMLPAKYAAMNNHAKRLHAHTVLRDKIQKWCVKTAQETGWTIDTVQREFAVQFGVNIFKAQVLSYTDAENLSQRIQL